MKRLYLSTTNRRIAGVCGGIGEYFNIDPTIVRVLFAIFAWAYGSAIFLYILLSIILPKDYEVQGGGQFKQSGPTYKRYRDFNQTNQRNQRKDVTPENEPTDDEWSNF